MNEFETLHGLDDMISYAKNVLKKLSYQYQHLRIVHMVELLIQFNKINWSMNNRKFVLII